METKLVKSDVFALLIKRENVQVSFNTKTFGVVAPAYLQKNKRSLVVDLGYNMPVPIADLAFNDAGIVATLSFGRCPHRCVVPWTAVYAMVGIDSGKGMIWPEAIPEGVDCVGQKRPATKQRGVMRLVK